MLLIAVCTGGGQWNGRCTGNEDLELDLEDLESFVNSGDTVMMRRDEDSWDEDAAWQKFEDEMQITINY